MARDIQARAQVRLTLEIPLSQPWGGECQLDQIFKQASESAKNKVRRVLQDAKITSRIIDMKVIAILAEDSHDA